MSCANNSSNVNETFIIEPYLTEDIYVTGGTYSNGTAIFTNNSGSTFSVTGFSTSTATAFTGGTVTGATIFTGGLTGNTISATTISATTYNGYIPLPYSGAVNNLDLGNNNLYVNDVYEKISVIPSISATTLILNNTSISNYIISGGTGNQIIQMPDATTLPSGATFTFNNNSNYIITINNGAISPFQITQLNSGAFTTLMLISNTSKAGIWDYHFNAPSNVSWSTNTFNYPGSITSAQWNGTNVALNRGGTNANITPIAGAIVYSTSSALTLTNSGTTGQILTSQGNAAPIWSTPITFTGGTIGDLTATTISATTISLPYASGSTLFMGPTGQITQNNSQLFWNNVNNRLGIGTSSPTNKLTVSGSANITGNLTITSNITAGSYNTLLPVLGGGSIDIGNSSTSYWSTLYATTFNSPTTLTLTSANNIVLNAGGAEAARIFNNGNVNIGTSTDSGFKLDVSGSTRIQGGLSATTYNGYTPANQDGTILYHSTPWFTPSGTVSTNSTIVTSSGSQFTSAMIGAKLTISGESRIIIGIGGGGTVYIAAPGFSQNYSNVPSGGTSWAVYSKSFANVDSANTNVFYDNTGVKKTYFDNSGNYINTSNYSIFNNNLSATTLTLGNISSYSGLTNLSGQFLSGTTNGFVLTPISAITGVDTYVTAFTYSNNVATIKRNLNQPDLSILINTMSGLTVTGTTSATTLNSGTVNVNTLNATGGTVTTLSATTANVTTLSAITLSATTLKLGNISSYSGLTNVAGQFLSGTTNGFALAPISAITGVDTYVTGFTYSSANNTITLAQNQGQTAKTVTISIVSGLTVSNLNPNYLVYTTTGGGLVTNTAASFDGTNMFLPAAGSLSVGTGGLVVGTGGSPSISGTGDVVINGSLTVFGSSISAFTSQLYVEDNNVTLNYNPTGNTTAASIGAGWTIQDGNGINGGNVNLDIRAMNFFTGLTSNNIPSIIEYNGSTDYTNRAFVTQLNDIVIRSTNITIPNGVRVLAEFDILDGGQY